MADTYFAALPFLSERFAREIRNRVDRHYARLPQSRQYQRAKRNYQLYYGLPSDASPFDVGEVGQAGEAGELSQVHVNHFHHLGQRVLTMTVQDEFGWQPEAANGDHQSQADAIIATSVLEYEKRDKRLDRVLHTQAETSLIYMEGYTLVEWDARGGKKYDVDPATQTPVYEGKLRVTNHTPLRVVFDVTRKDANHPWVIVVEFQNKWDLAARYPAFREHILRLSPDHRELLNWRSSTGRHAEEADEVPVYRFFHRPTESVPGGREAVVIDANCAPLFDGPTTHGEELPLLPMAPGYMIDTPFGASPLTDISGLQQVYNMLLSTAVTNAANGGLATIAVPKAANISPSDLEGARLFEYEGDQKPEAMEFAHTAPEVFELADTVRTTMQQLVGMSDTTMGTASPELSGAAMALLDSKALQFATLFISSYRKAVQDLGTAIIRLYKRHAKAPRQLEVIVGQGRKYLLPGFTGEKLGAIDRVTVEAKNALTDTAAGRLDLAEKLIQMGVLGPDKAQDLVQVLKTGNLDPVLEGPEREHMLIKAENDMISRGEVPPVLLSDPPLLHLQHHRTCVATPEARSNPAIVQAYTQHEQMHLDALRNSDPLTLQIMGVPPEMMAVLFPPAPAPGMGPPLPPGGAGSPPPPQDLGASVGPQPPGAAPLPDMPSMPSMPNLPSGEPYNPGAPQ